MRQLEESNVKAKVGTVAHRSNLNDPHIQKALDYLVANTNKTKAEIIAHIQDKEKEFKDLEAKSPILYSAIAANIVEQELYKLFREMKVPEPAGVAKFDPVTFSALIRRIKAENPSVFPLRNFIDKKPIASPRIILVPTDDPKDKHFNQIETAAATPQGEFIFNVDCMQRDMNFAYTQGIKAKGKKYKSNGGPFPDEWAPVEFTVMHEFFHYTHGDFHYGKVLGGDPTIHNWTGDFRSNHDLIKAGYHPYAEGLFSDYVNYDNYKSYQEMYEAVLAEFKKLNKNQQQKVQQQLGGLGDDHSPHAGEKQKPMPGQGEPGAEDLEEHAKNVSKKVGKKDEGKGEEGGDKPGSGPPSGGRGGRGGSPTTPTKVDYKGIKPRYDWKTLLARLVRSADTTETTYQKVHRRNITSVHLAQQLGAGVVRPGEKEVPANLVKLAIVVDSSGSMMGSITKVLANVQKLLMDGSNAVARSFVFVEFSSDYHMFVCTFAGKSGTAREVKSIAEIKSGGGSKPDRLESILTRYQGGGTNFSDELADNLSKLAGQGYNILILTDSDIATHGNKEAFLQLYAKHRQQVYLILDSRPTFQSVAASMKGASANMSHL